MASCGSVSPVMAARPVGSPIVRERAASRVDARVPAAMAAASVGSLPLRGRSGFTFAVEAGIGS